MLQHTPHKTAETILIRGANQLLTLRGPKTPRRGKQLGDLGLVPDGALLIQNGCILEAGPARRLENLAQARGALEINAAGRVVMPGFVDPHTHLLWPSGGAEGADPDRAARYLRTATGQRIESRARRLVDAMARHGSTTVEVKTGFGVEENVEAKLLRVLAALHEHPLDIVATFLLNLPEEGREEALQSAIDVVLPRIRRGRLARFADIACGGAEEPPFGLERYLHAAQALGFRTKVHAHGGHPAQAILQAAAHRSASIDHLEHATAAEAELLAGTSLVAVLLPADSFHHRGPLGPARLFADAGVAIALGTNFNPRECPTFNMQTVVALAVREARLTPEEAISAATVNAAHALELAGKTGTLEQGKAADVLMLNISDYRELSTSFGGNLVAMAMRGGQVIYRESPVGVPANSAPEAE